MPRQELLIRHEYQEQQYYKDRETIAYAQALKTENDALQEKISRMRLSNVR